MRAGLVTLDAVGLRNRSRAVPLSCRGVPGEGDIPIFAAESRRPRGILSMAAKIGTVPQRLRRPLRRHHLYVAFPQGSRQANDPRTDSISSEQFLCQTEQPGTAAQGASRKFTGRRTRRVSAGHIEETVENLVDEDRAQVPTGRLARRSANGPRETAAAVLDPRQDNPGDRLAHPNVRMPEYSASAIRPS